MSEDKFEPIDIGDMLTNAEFISILNSPSGKRVTILETQGVFYRVAYRNPVLEADKSISLDPKTAAVVWNKPVVKWVCVDG